MSNAKQRVLLVSILHGSHRNLSCLALYAYLKEAGIDIRLLFIPDEEQYRAEPFRAFLAEQGFGVVGISLMTDGFAFAQQLTAEVRRVLPEVHVAWGGIHPTLKPDECVEVADSACVGEGEIAFLEVVRRHFAGQPMTAIPGLCARSADDGVTKTPPSRIVDLDALPHQRYCWEDFFVLDRLGLRTFDHAEYVRYSSYNGEDYTLMATRGCPFSCSYCCNNYLNSLYEESVRVRKRSVSHVLAELHHAKKTIPNIKFINFIDDQFLTSRRWNEEFIKRYREEIGLPFIIRLVPGSFDDAVLKSLVQAGMKFAQVGIQSGSPRTHKEIFRRKFNREALIKSSRILSSNGVHPFYDVIIQNDLEKDEDRDATIRLLLDIARPFSLNLYALTTYPGTALEGIFREAGISSTRDPYGRGYCDYDETDYYFQLTTIIPKLHPQFAKVLFRLKGLALGRMLVKQLYLASKRRKKRVVTAQATKEAGG